MNLKVFLKVQKYEDQYYIDAFYGFENKIMKTVFRADKDTLGAAAYLCRKSRASQSSSLISLYDYEKKQFVNKTNICEEHTVVISGSDLVDDIRDLVEVLTAFKLGCGNLDVKAELTVEYEGEWMTADEFWQNIVCKQK